MGLQGTILCKGKQVTQEQILYECECEKCEVARVIHFVILAVQKHSFMMLVITNLNYISKHFLIVFIH